MSSIRMEQRGGRFFLIKSKSPSDGAPPPSAPPSTAASMEPPSQAGDSAITASSGMPDMETTSKVPSKDSKSISSASSNETGRPKSPLVRRRAAINPSKGKVKVISKQEPLAGPSNRESPSGVEQEEMAPAVNATESQPQCPNNQNSSVSPAVSKKRKRACADSGPPAAEETEGPPPNKRTRRTRQPSAKALEAQEVSQQPSTNPPAVPQASQQSGENPPTTQRVTRKRSAKPATVEQATQQESAKPPKVQRASRQPSAKPPAIPKASRQSSAKPPTVPKAAQQSNAKPPTARRATRQGSAKPTTKTQQASAKPTTGQRASRQSSANPPAAQRARQASARATSVQRTTRQPSARATPAQQARRQPASRARARQAQQSPEPFSFAAPSPQPLNSTPPQENRDANAPLPLDEEGYECDIEMTDDNPPQLRLPPVVEVPSYEGTPSSATATGAAPTAISEPATTLVLPNEEELFASRLLLGFRYSNLPQPERTVFVDDMLQDWADDMQDRLPDYVLPRRVEQHLEEHRLRKAQAPAPAVEPKGPTGA